MLVGISSVPKQEQGNFYVVIKGKTLKCVGADRNLPSKTSKNIGKWILLNL